MSVYDDDSYCNGSGGLDDDDLLDAFSRLPVYVRFDSDGRGRRPVEEIIAAHPGWWVCVYSTFERLSAVYHGTEIEWSSMAGKTLLALVSNRCGIWLDRSYPGGRQILVPPVDITTDVG